MNSETWSAAADPLYRLQLRGLWHALTAQSAAFWILCGYLVIEYVRPQSIYPAMDVIPWGKTVLLLALTVRLFDREPIAWGGTQSVLLGLFLAVVLLSWLFAYRPDDAVERVVTYLTWGLVYFLVMTTVTSERRWLLFLLLFLLCNLKMSQHATLTWVGRGFGYASWGATGAPGWFHNSGELGIEMCIFLPLSAYFLVALRACWPTWKQALFLALPLTAGAAIVASNSRGAMLAAALVMLWVAVRHGRRLSVLVLVAAIGTGAYLSLPDESRDRFASAGRDETSENRLLRWQAAVDTLKDNPLLGIGPGNWMAYYTSHYPREPGREGWGLQHNIFLDAGTELGAAGLLLFGSMALYGFVQNRRTRRAAERAGNRFVYCMALGFDAALIGFLVSGSFVSVLFYPFFWVNAAFITALNRVAGGLAARGVAVEEPPLVPVLYRGPRWQP